MMDRLMKTLHISLQNLGFALLAVALGFFAFAANASAASYYYPQVGVPVYYQPVYQYQTQTRVQTQDYAQLIAQIQSLLAQIQQLQNQYRLQYGHPYVGVGNIVKYNTGVYGGYQYGNYDIDVDTLYARNINDDYATLYGDVDLDDAPYADVWFEYGTDGSLDEDSDDDRITSDGKFSIKVDNLDDNEKYYFRAVAEDPSGDRVYGTIKSFEADRYSSSNNYDEPDVETGDVDDVDDDSAQLNGDVDMNDYDNGDVFFVYGQDESQVEDVEDEDRYSDIDEDGDDLQKYKVYDNLDNYRSFWLNIYGLDDNTDYYYRICVGYEDEDNDDVLTCGDVEHFETD